MCLERLVYFLVFYLHSSCIVHCILQVGWPMNCRPCLHAVYLYIVMMLIIWLYIIAYWSHPYL